MAVRQKVGRLIASPFTIFVEGNIGSGKTTFLNRFRNLDALLLSEPVNEWVNVGKSQHNLLNLLYEDPKLWSMTFQSYVYKTMLNNHLKNTSKSIKIMERSLFSARYCFVETLFQQKNLASPSYAVLDEWFKWINENFNIRGDLIVYLRTSPLVVYERIMDRGRTEEQCITLNYLQQLHKVHDDWLLGKQKFPCKEPVFTIDADKNLIAMEDEYKHIENLIQSKMLN